jgi:hypothetical protein
MLHCIPCSVFIAVLVVGFEGEYANSHPVCASPRVGLAVQTVLGFFALDKGGHIDVPDRLDSKSEMSPQEAVL